MSQLTLFYTQVACQKFIERFRQRSYKFFKPLSTLPVFLETVLFKCVETQTVLFLNLDKKKTTEKNLCRPDLVFAYFSKYS